MILDTTVNVLGGRPIHGPCRVGSKLCMILVAAAKLWLGKPVLTINAAIYWHVLPADGIAEKREGFGRIFEEF